MSFTETGETVGNRFGRQDQEFAFRRIKFASEHVEGVWRSGEVRTLTSETLRVIERERVLQTMKLDKTTPEMNTGSKQTPPKYRCQRNERKPAKEIRRTGAVLETKWRKFCSRL